MGNKWKNLRSYWNKPQRAAYLFLLPAAILILVFNIIPLFASFFISMLDMGISFNSAKFIGLDNFKEALTDRRFINSLIVTIKFTVIEVPIQMVLGACTLRHADQKHLYKQAVSKHLLYPDCMLGYGNRHHVADYPSFKCRTHYILGETFRLRKS